ncbi:hypothetical protein EPO15_00855 [bacterium]|nr:MAG: hypothetical protein EPO15_00855 [bacterium]
MIPQALLAAMLARADRPPAPSAELPPQVYFGAELGRPFLPVLPPRADDGAPAPAGWLAAPASLVLAAKDGTVLHELGVGRWSAEDGALRREMRGAASKDGRSAWHWQKVAEGEKTASVLVYLGAHGQILRRLDGADAPAGLPPAALSGDGAILLAALRTDGAWTATAYSFGGKELASVTKAHRVTALSVSEDGRRALVAWSGLDLPEMVTLLDLRRGERLDLPAERLPAGPWTLAPDGTLLAAGRPVPRTP